MGARGWNDGWRRGLGAVAAMVALSLTPGCGQLGGVHVRPRGTPAHPFTPTSTDRS